MCWSQDGGLQSCTLDWQNHHFDLSSIRNSCYCKSWVQISYAEKENAFQYFNTNIDMNTEFIQKSLTVQV